MERVDLIRIGIIAARMWNIEANVGIEFAPDNQPYKLQREDGTRERTAYSVPFVEDVVKFQQWRGPNDFNVWLGYSKKLGVLVAHVPSS